MRAGNQAAQTRTVVLENMVPAAMKWTSAEILGEQ